MINILAIGNSFSVDALFYFEKIASASGVAVADVNLYIGGCSLQQHWQNLQEDACAYSVYRAGAATQEKSSIAAMLQQQTWDIVTIQQASHDSGLVQTYEPYGTELIRCIRQYAPNAKIYFHKTWAYEIDSNHTFFPRYGCDQKRMYDALCSASGEFVQRHGLAMIPSGDVIQKLRTLPAFDYQNGGLSLCADGFHMSRTYGRYAVAATWAEILLGLDIRNNTYAPEETDPVLLGQIRQVVHQVCGA